MNPMPKKEQPCFLLDQYTHSTHGQVPQKQGSLKEKRESGKVPVVPKTKSPNTHTADDPQEQTCQTMVIPGRRTYYPSKYLLRDPCLFR